MPEIEYYSTSEMGLVGYLRMQIGDPQKVEWVSGSCKWYFILTTGLLGLVDQYHQNQAFVDPKEYDRHMNNTRREFYDAKMEFQGRG